MGFLAALPMAAISLGMGAVGTGISAFGAVEGAQAQSANAAYQSQIAANNAKIANQNASWTMQSGEAQAQQEGMKTRSEVGAIKAAQAGNNIDVNSGSAVDVRSSASQLGELNALTIRSNASRQAYGYETQSMNETAQSQLEASQSSQALDAGMFSVAGSLLGGASSFAGNYMKDQAMGLLGSS